MPCKSRSEVLKGDLEDDATPQLEAAKRVDAVLGTRLATESRIIQFFVYSMPTNIYASVGPDVG
jgi:hypothetical protein